MADIYLERDIPKIGRVTFEQRESGYRAYKFAGLCEFCMGFGYVNAKGAKQDCVCEGGYAKAKRVPSVTTMLGKLFPFDAIRWAENIAARDTLILARQGELNNVDPEEAGQAIRDHGLGVERARQEGANRGTSLHDALEDYLRTGSPPNPITFPEDRRGYVKGLAGFLSAVNLEPEHIERMVVHPRRMYAGRMDIWGRVDGALEVVDLKSSAKRFVPPKHVWQLRLYAAAEVACGEPCPVNVRVVVLGEDGRWDQHVRPVNLDAVEKLFDWYAVHQPEVSACDARARRMKKEAA